MVAAPVSCSTLQRRALWLEYATIAVGSHGEVPARLQKAGVVAPRVVEPPPHETH